MRLINKLLLSGFMCILIGMPSAFASEQIPSAKKHDWKNQDKNQEWKMFRQLNLTEEQKTQLKANKEAKKLQMKASFEKIRVQKEALQQELMNPQLDMEKINAIQGQLKGQMSEMADQRLNSILEVRKILTPDQFSQFVKNMPDRSEWRHRWKKGSEQHDKSQK